MPKKILGSGWNFPVKLNEKNSIASSFYEQKVEESIVIILSTAKGERVMRPDFGCDIHDYVFELIESTTLTFIETAVREALILWEPRIEVMQVDVYSPRMDEGILNIEIQYRIRYTDTTHNLVYPFFLEGYGQERHHKE